MDDDSLLNSENLEVMIKTIVRQYHWSPDIIGDLFVDDNDYKGLEFWYKDALQVNSELKTKTPDV